MYLLCGLLLINCISVYAVDLSTNKPPNIIIIIADDVGRDDFGFYGSNQIPTPNIDALAYNGVIMDKFYTLHACTPSRAALLTGMYPIHLGLQGSPIAAGNNRSLPSDITILPQHLKKLNYSTHLVGKWHLGGAYKKDLPTQRGFDTHFGYWHGFVGYFNYMQAQVNSENMIFRGLDLHDDFEPLYTYTGQYATDLFTVKSLDIIDQHSKDKKPFFLVVSHLAGHTGDNDTELGVPDIELANRKYKYITIRERRLYADVINRLDDSVGKIVQKLSEEQMLENSILLFFSDNGAPASGLYKNFASNWPLRGMKMTLFEGAVKGSSIMFSPLFKKQSYINNEFIHITDIMPTLYHAAGGNVNDLGNIDGYDQWETLSRNSPSPREEALLNIDELMQFSGIITEKGRYKLLNGSSASGLTDGYFGDEFQKDDNPAYEPSTIIKSKTNIAIAKIPNRAELSEKQIITTRQQVALDQCRLPQHNPKPCLDYCLFDLEKDPCETTNIIEALPTLAAKLKEKLTGYNKNLVRQGSKVVDNLANPIYYNGTWCTWLDSEGCPKTEAHVSILQYVLDSLESFLI